MTPQSKKNSHSLTASRVATGHHFQSYRSPFQKIVLLQLNGEIQGSSYFISLNTKQTFIATVAALLCPLCGMNIRISCHSPLATQAETAPNQSNTPLESFPVNFILIIKLKEKFVPSYSYSERLITTSPQDYRLILI